MANTVVDLSTVPQEYVPYPGGDDTQEGGMSLLESLTNPLGTAKRAVLKEEKKKCSNCTVHAGFMTSWRHTRAEIMPHLEEAVANYPGYQLTLVGHSLGGAVAALAALDFQARGWNPQVTTFGEPRIGNQGLVRYIDDAFSSDDKRAEGVLGHAMYRRVTHVDDPIPLLPLEEWGYRMHAGEVFISKPETPPSVVDLRRCTGDEDPLCIAGADAADETLDDEAVGQILNRTDLMDWWKSGKKALTLPARYRLWQLFFAHRDYFWRLGLCVPGGDPGYGDYPGLIPGLTPPVEEL